MKAPRGHKLMTVELKKQLPTLYSQEEIEDPMVLIHYFNPYGSGDWFGIEFDGEDRFFGYACIHCCELGYFSLKELEEIYVTQGGYEFPLERDLYWKPKKLSEIQEKMEKRYPGW